MTSIQVQVEPKKRYFWAVDTYEAGAEEPTWGPVFDFLVDNQPPIVKAGSDVTTWLSDGTVDVALGAIVEDSDPTTAAWAVVAEPNEGMALIADPTQLETVVTLTELGTYVLQIEASDGQYTGSDTVTINVFSDSCQAAQSLPDYVPIPGDLNGDCVVNEEDLAILQQHWMECNALDCSGLVDPNAL